MTSAASLKQTHTVTVPADKIEAARKAQIAAIAPRVNLKGFRPGKAPIAAVERQYGDSVMQDVLDKVINDAIKNLVDDTKVKMAGRPNVNVTKFDKDSELVMEISFEVLPEIKPFDVKNVKLERLTADVNESDIDETMERLAKQLRTRVPAAGKAAALGDSVTIDFKGWLNDVARDDMAGKGAELELGSNSFIPGFEEKLVGAKAGETVTFDITFPAEYHHPDFKSQPAKFEVVVHDVSTFETPAIDDAMAKKLGQESLEQLKNRIRDNIKGEYSEQSRLKLKKELFDKIETAHQFPLPEGMVEQEYKLICEQIEHERHGHAHGHDDDQNHEHHTHISDDERVELKKIAERRVRVGLVLAEIGTANGITVTDDDLRKGIIARANMYPGMQARVIEQFQKNPQMIENLRPSIFEEKTVDFIMELADISDKTVSKDELMADIED